MAEVDVDRPLLVGNRWVLVGAVLYLLEWVTIIAAGLDAESFQLNDMIYGPAGVSVLCAGIAMWRSGLFHRALSALAFAGGGLLALGAVAFAAPGTRDLLDAMTMGILLIWAWMLWLGVVLWRHTPAGRPIPDRTT